jgi:hypothetical protein
MKEILQDIIAHTYNLGFLNIVKVTGTDKITSIDSMSDDRRVVMFGESKTPYAEMIGVFGMPQLNKLKYNLDCPEYKEDATISIVTEMRNGIMLPVGLNFKNKDDDFKNDYKFMNTEIINEKLKSVKFKSVKWDVEIEPTILAVQRFQFQAAANNEHTTFLTKVSNKTLRFVFGDISTHGGEFVFATDVTGTLKRKLTWPVSIVLAILKLAKVNSTTLSLSDEGALMITLDSGLAIYRYIIPAQA